MTTQGNSQEIVLGPKSLFRFSHKMLPKQTFGQPNKSHESFPLSSKLGTSQQASGKQCKIFLTNQGCIFHLTWPASKQATVIKEIHNGRKKGQGESKTRETEFIMCMWLHLYIY